MSSSVHAIDGTDLETIAIMLNLCTTSEDMDGDVVKERPIVQLSERSAEMIRDLFLSTQTPSSCAVRTTETGAEIENEKRRSSLHPRTVGPRSAARLLLYVATIASYVRTPLAKSCNEHPEARRHLRDGA